MTLFHMQIYSNTNVLHSLEDLRGILFLFFFSPPLHKTLNATHAAAIESTNATGFI